jgi:HlyD family secretion protein
MTERTKASWLVYALGALCAGAILAAVLLVGPASSSTTSITRTAKVAQGVVQSTVSGSGNLQAASQLNLGFKTSGTVTHIYVTQGEHVAQGQLLATLDPQSAEVTLEQAKASLQSAEANLAKEQETNGESSTGASSSGSGAGNASAASAASASDARVSYTATATGTPTYTSPTSPASTTTAPSDTPATTAPTSAAPPATTPASSTPASTTPASTTPANTTPASGTPAKTTPTTTSPGKRTTSRSGSSPSNSTSTGHERDTKQTSSDGASSKSTLSTATREANLASAKAAVRSDTLTVQSDEQAVQDTKLYAPESGTIVSLGGQVGEVVSGSGTTRASSASSSSSGSGSSATGASGASSAARSATGSSSSTGSTGSSSSSLAVLSDLSSMQLVVALSESEIGSVKDGQIATVTVEALSGSKLAAHVSEVALLSTSTSGAVSYDVTFQLDQLVSGLKIGMSATAEVVVKQAEGLNVPTSAISVDEVTVERGGKQVRQRVLTGLAGNTSTIIASGLKAGETVVLPAASTAGSSTSLSSRLGRAGGLGAAGLGAAAGGGLPGGGAAFFRGGG